jgi:uncharacterized membrane protein YidH (DUF202 family)
LSGVPPGAQVDAAAGAEDPGLARERTSLAWTRSGLSIAASGALIVRGCLSAHLDALGIVIAVVMAIVAISVWRHGQETYSEPGLSAPDRRRQSGILAGLTIATVLTALLAIVVTFAV